MLALTSMSFLLLQKTEVSSQQASAVKKSYDMDLYLKHFTIHYYDKTGAIKTQLQSDYAQHSNLNETLTVKPLLMLHRTGLRRYRAAADEALLSDDSQTAQLRGRAVIQSIDSSKTPLKNMRIESEQIDLNMTLEQIKSNTPSQLWSDSYQSKSNQFFYDNVTGQMTLTGKVKATIVPKQ